MIQPPWANIRAWNSSNVCLHEHSIDGHWIRTRQGLATTEY
jgi:hypothetical protein